MSEIHQIEQKLQEIGDAVFQELCDHILFLEETEWQLVSKLGSVLGWRIRSKVTHLVRT